MTGDSSQKATLSGRFARGTSSKREAAKLMISARLQVLQSRRLIIRTLERRMEPGSPVEMHERIARMRSQAEQAQGAYRTAVLSLGTPESPDFWLIAYGRLIDVGNATVRRLRKSTADLPVDERYRVSADVEELEDIIEGWTESMCAAMSPAGA